MNPEELLTPKGITETRADDGTAIIVFRRAGYPWLPTVLAIPLVAFLLAACVSIYMAIRWPTTSADQGTAVLVQSVAIPIQTLLLALLPWHLMAKTRIEMSEHDLRVTFEYLWMRRVVSVHKTDVQRIVRWHSGGALIWPSGQWSLRIDGSAEVVITTNDGAKPTLWLGERISQWAGAPFIELVG